MAVRQWRRRLARRQLRSRPRVPTAVLHANGRVDRQSGRAILPLRHFQPFPRRWPNDERRWARRTWRSRRGGGSAGGRAGCSWRRKCHRRPRRRLERSDPARVGRWRQPRHVDRSHECQPDGRCQRRRRLDLDDTGAELVARATADRADVSRHRRQPRAVLRLRQQAGRTVVSRPEQQSHRESDRAQRVARRRGRREWLGDARSRRLERRLVDGIGLGEPRWHRRQVRRAAPPGAERGGVSVEHRRHASGRREVSLHLGRAIRDLAARPQQGLHWQPVRAHVDRWWAQLARYQPGPYTQRQIEAADLGRPDPRRHRRRVWRRRVCDRGIAADPRLDLGGDK